MSDRDTIIKQINDLEHRLTSLRADRDSQIAEAYAKGTSKYRLAKDWAVSENTITRIVTGIKPGKQPGEKRA